MVPPPDSAADSRRALPAVDQLLQRPGVPDLIRRFGRGPVVREARALLDRARRSPQAIAAGTDWATELARGLEMTMAASLARVINATGVVVHTNLGRAPLAPRAAARVAHIAAGYSNLEYDLASGERGNREVHAEERLKRLLGAEGSAVVNNCAAAVLLAVNTFAEGREVLVSRGELVEIGGSFRIPEILRKSGARLREVGTTNKTRASDYRAAMSSDTGLILRVHPSNFRIVGFTESPALRELVDVAATAGVPLVEDLGSGLIEAPPGLESEPTVGASLQDGASIVTFSGDKLLGGPQAGLIVGQGPLVAAMRRNPLYRALRVDKMTIAALDATLAEHESGRAAEAVPVLRMLSAAADGLRGRCAALAERLTRGAPQMTAVVEEGISAVGGGAAPTLEIPGPVVAVAHARLSASTIASALRAATPPVIVRISNDRVVVDLRTVLPSEDEALAEALVAAARD